MTHHRHPPLSDEQLNAYIDDELDFEERRNLYEQMEADPQLSLKAQELRQLRYMLHDAYQQPPRPQPHRRSDGRRLHTNALAASLLLAVGVLFGWFGNAQLTTDTQAVMPGSLAQVQDNLLLHLSSNDPQKMDAALDYAEQFLLNQQQQGKRYRLELVANDGGVELLRRDTSPYAQRIQALQRRYDNVSFLACANALRRLRENGHKVELLPEAKSDNNAIDEIVQRLEGGWRYLKV